MYEKIYKINFSVGATKVKFHLDGATCLASINLCVSVCLCGVPSVSSPCLLAVGWLLGWLSSNSLPEDQLGFN